MTAPPIREEIKFDCWPDGKLVAIFPVVNVEVFIPGKGGPAIQPHLTSDPEIANSGWRDYGNRAGLYRLVRTFTELNIPASAALNADVIIREPEVFRTIMNTKDWDIVGHGLNNSTGQTGLDLEREIEDVGKALSVIKQETGRLPVGWLTPGFKVTHNTNYVLSKLGVKATLDATNDDVVHRLKLPNPDDPQALPRSIVVLPYSMETNDISLCLSSAYTAQEYGDALIDNVKQLVAEAKFGKPTIVAFGLHTFVAGTPAKALHLKRALETISKMDHVWFANCTMIINHIESTQTQTH